MQAGGTYEIEVSDGNTSITLNNILLGDVWLCSGQSNKGFPLRSAEKGAVGINKAGHHASLRLYQLSSLQETANTSWDSLTLSETNRQNFFSGSLKTASPEAAADFSAIGYFLDRQV
jgi:sialate O-acetylesterase